ncbi:hypothetical protein [Ammoniphilus resinae]|uniref:Uncharacterized protein n=1 Tax=Ammoniphilus resinae TaxID=861532 RepID=A0ABS4GT34_9BACL|nr:hypothetical protein [Ammoniphilus resinae]MBP1933399.1 hypothetical protein [Ammoniphilus resinae]
MKLRTMPVMLSLISTLALLFGGWYTYQHFYIKQPVQDFIAAKNDLILNDLKITQDQVVVDIDFKNPEKFVSDYKEINQYMEEQMGGKEILIRLPQYGEKMRDLWEDEYFGVAEAIQTKEYTKIPLMMEEMKKKEQLQQAMAKMDEDFVYLYLQNGTDHLYAVLPLKEEVKDLE